VSRAFRTGFRKFFPDNIEGLGITIVRASCVVSVFRLSVFWDWLTQRSGYDRALTRTFQKDPVTAVRDFLLFHPDGLADRAHERSPSS
jgi:hypothetical protein